MIAAAPVSAAQEGSPVIGGILFAAIIVGLFIWWRVDVRTRPWLPCRTCNGSPRRASAFRENAWGSCPACGGSGRRPRSILRRRDP